MVKSCPWFIKIRAVHTCVYTDLNQSQWQSCFASRRLAIECSIKELAFSHRMIEGALHVIMWCHVSHHPCRLCREERERESRYVILSWVSRASCFFTVWSVVAERSSLPDSSSGVSSRMWVRIPAVTLVSLSKTLNHNCFSPPRG